MNITLSPQRRDDALVVIKQGDKLTINGVVFDFAPLPDGATLPGTAVNCEFILGDVERIDGDLHLNLLLPIGPDASEAARFPQPLINPTDGLLEFPQ